MNQQIHHFCSKFGNETGSVRQSWQFVMSLIYHVQIASGFSMFNRLIGYFLKTNLENVEKI